MPRLFNIDCATLPQQVALNRDNIKQLAEWLTNNPDIGNISVTTLAPGSQATATITRRYDAETDKAYIDVTLGIPQGIQGETGPKGEPGEQGPKGDPGSDLFTDFTSVKIDTSAAHVAYSDGTAHITDATLIGYKSTGNEEVECAVDIPIVAGSGVTVDANEANNAIEVSATGGGSFDGTNVTIWRMSDKEGISNNIGNTFAIATVINRVTNENTNVNVCNDGDLVYGYITNTSNVKKFCMCIVTETSVPNQITLQIVYAIEVNKAFIYLHELAISYSSSDINFSIMVELFTNDGYGYSTMDELYEVLNDYTDSINPWILATGYIVRDTGQPADYVGRIQAYKTGVNIGFTVQSVAQNGGTGYNTTNITDAMGGINISDNIKKLFG